MISDPQYDQIWLVPSIDAMGDDAGAEGAEILKAVCNDTIYGQDAIDIYGEMIPMA